MKTPSPRILLKALSKNGPCLRRSRLLCVVISLGFAVSHAEDKTPAQSYEEMFMGQKRPFAQRGPAPVPGAKPEDTARALYSNEVFFNLRNSFPQPITDYLSPCFSPGLLQHFAQSRADIQEWMTLHKDDLMKLPMGEGSIFLSCYEGGDEFSIGTVKVEGDKAEVTIKLNYHENGKAYPWQDVAVLIRSSGKWLLDDIRFDVEENTGRTLRKRTQIPKAKP
ncbi:hypothetical protein [Prosthecobacter sp.]|uniref:hypothetical protein n=1 Tax=Prosthecobacter sp. TaxID=1965333 RepID=UPI0037843698